jgi:hypothetical protein
MSIKKRKRRSIQASRAASLKAARTRKLMREMRAVAEKYQLDPIGDFFREHSVTLDDILPPEPTINRVPKVKW